MRLLNVSTRKLEAFFGRPIPPYVILSHTWGDGEVLYEDLGGEAAPFPDHKLGALKIRLSCSWARRKGYEYIWIDTCCIDKASSAELSEAINSMFRWYRDCEICYVYLNDVDKEAGNYKSQMAKSRWFTRGWTLQELIAPGCITFHDRTGASLGQIAGEGSQGETKISRLVARLTGIPTELIQRRGRVGCREKLKETGGKSVRHYFLDTLGRRRCQKCHRPDDLHFIMRKFSVAQRLSWASRRSTTRLEDESYCLLGLFNVTMPLLYGEGGRAFMRLQEEIIKQAEDQSILAFGSFAKDYWDSNDDDDSALATSPRDFAGSPVSLAPTRWADTIKSHMAIQPSTNTVEVDMVLAPVSLDELDELRTDRGPMYLGILNCSHKDDLLARIAILIEQSPSDKQFYRRVCCANALVISPADEKGRILASLDPGDLSELSYDLANIDAQSAEVRVHLQLQSPQSVLSLRYSPDPRIALEIDFSVDLELLSADGAYRKGPNRLYIASQPQSEDEGAAICFKLSNHPPVFLYLLPGTVSEGWSTGLFQWAEVIDTATLPACIDNNQPLETTRITEEHCDNPSFRSQIERFVRAQRETQEVGGDTLSWSSAQRQEASTCTPAGEPATYSIEVSMKAFLGLPLQQLDLKTSRGRRI